MTTLSTRLRAAALLLVGLAAVSCDRMPAAPEAAPSLPAPRANLGAVPGWSSPDANDPALVALLRSEQARIASLASVTEGLLGSATGLLGLDGGKRASLVGGLLACTPLPYTGQAAIIGPEGGVVNAGPHRLVIPAGALAQPTVISAEVAPGPEVAVTFSPHGLRFLESPRLSLGYKHCGRTLGGARVVYVDDTGQVLEETVSLGQRDNRVDALIGHFSKYAVAGNRL